jgi:hypothetical protein
MLLRYVERFGADAIYGRALSADEVMSMILAENVVNYYTEREAAPKGDWAAWGRSNPDKADLLAAALSAAVELGLIENLSEGL